MIFAAIDYFNFSRRSGRFGQTSGHDVMCGAFQEELPQELIDKLQPGDTIVIGNYDWWVAWLIMYLTSSQVSHIAIYCGQQNILHQTLSGLEFGPIHNLFGPNVRLLPIKLPVLPGETRSPITSEVADQYHAMPYPIWAVIRKGINIVIGRDWRYFRFKFAADILLLIFLVCLPMAVISD